MHQCQFCLRTFKNNSPLLRHLILCTKIFNFCKKFSFTKAKIKEEYEKLGSVIEFSKKYPGFSDSFYDYYKIFKFFEIKTSIKQAANHSNTKNKRKKTLIKKTGFDHNFCKNSPSRKAWEKRLLEKEGITNVFQRKEVKKKSLKTMLTKYGSRNTSYFNKGSSITKLNKWLYNVLNNNNISYSAEFILKKDKSYYSYDICIGNKIIEVHGDYWHGNPKLYKPDDIILKNSTNEILVKDKWKKDELKINHAKKAGYEVLIIWELEIKQCEEKVIKKILNYVNKN